MILTKLAPGQRDDIALAVDLVNTWDVMADPPEVLRGVDQLRRLLTWHGHTEAAAAATEADVRRARSLGTGLRQAFDAADEAEAVRVLNEVVREAGTVPQLVRDDGRWRLRHGPPETTPAFLAPATALALLGVILRDGWDRFGVCAASPCCCVYVDRSRTRSRRYCCHYCADRVNQARYRRRRTRTGQV
jgi:predicted RNA-binding Zn ribbon-like protein